MPAECDLQPFLECQARDHAAILTWPLEGLKLDEYCLNYFLILRQKHAKTSANFALENLDLATRDLFFIELLIVLWFKEWAYLFRPYSRAYFIKKLSKVVILPIIMVLEENQFMVKNSKMKILKWNTMYQAYYPWQMLAQVPTALSYGI